jgi:hypothetical protein
MAPYSTKDATELSISSVENLESVTPRFEKLPQKFLKHVILGSAKKSLSTS